MLNMPELPEVETVRRGLEPFLVGQIIGEVKRSASRLRYPLPSGFSTLLQGRKVKAIGRRAKYLLLDLEGDLVLLSHLGMSGSFRIEADNIHEVPGQFVYGRSKSELHDHVSFTLLGGVRIIYNDPRRFGFMDIVKKERLDENRFLKRLGVEPLGNELSPEIMVPMLLRSQLSLKAFLLDQSKIAGLGNIYVCEVLHRCRLSPERPARTLLTSHGTPRNGLAQLCDEIKKVLNEAIEAGGSSLRDHQRVDGVLGYFQHSFRVYGREGECCQTPNCYGIVERLVHSGRSTFLCRKCQR
jgi:formamidopyrimidine-DNA glycosylase